MLVLVYVAGVEIWIEVVDQGGGWCRLGFDAPKEVSIHREKHLRQQEERRAPTPQA